MPGKPSLEHTPLATVRLQVNLVPYRARHRCADAPV
jgi:hypothetical protein